MFYIKLQVVNQITLYSSLSQCLKSIRLQKGLHLESTGS